MSDLFTKTPRCIRAVGSGSTQLRVWDNGMCSYRYEIGGGGWAEFSLLSEVGEPHKPVFERLIRAFEVEIAPGAIELPGHPFIADKLLTMRT